MERFLPDALLPILKVLVIESRPLSLMLADQLSVKHESPQMILVYENRAVWSASHGKVKADNLAQAQSDWL